MANFLPYGFRAWISTLQPPISGLGSETSTCSFWVGVGTLILIFIGLEVIHVDLGSQGGGRKNPVRYIP